MRVGGLVTGFAVALGLAATANPDVEVLTLDQARVRGEVIALAPGTPPTVEVALADGTRKTLRLDETIEVVVHGNAGPPAADVEAVLKTGEIIRGTLASAEGERLRIESPAAGAVTLTLSHLRWLRYLGPEILHPDPSQRLSPDVDIVFERDGATRQPEGIVDGFEGRSVAIQSEQLKRRFLCETERVGAIWFGDPTVPPEPPGLVATIEGIDGSLLRGRVRDHRAGILTVESASGLVFKAPLSGLARLSFAGGRFIYLSDLAPTKVREIPHVFDPVVEHLAPIGPGAATNFHADRCYPGDRAIRLGTHAYRKGLGLHSWVEATWDLRGEWTSLTGLCGVDDHVAELPGDVAERGSVIFRFLVDGKERLRLPQTGFLAAGAEPAPLTLDLAGAKTLAIVVDYAGNPGPPDYADTHIRDRAVIAQPRLIR